MITAEVALYPLKTSDATTIINDSIHALDNTTVDYKINSMNTQIMGKKEEVFKSIREMFDQAELKGTEVSMVVTVTNAGEWKSLK